MSPWQDNVRWTGDGTGGGWQGRGEEGGARWRERGRSHILKGYWNKFNPVYSRRSTSPPAFLRRLSPLSIFSASLVASPRKKTRISAQALYPASPHTMRKDGDYSNILHGFEAFPRVKLAGRQKRFGTPDRPRWSSRRRMQSVRCRRPIRLSNANPLPKRDGPDPAKLSSPSASVPIGSDRSPEPTTEKIFVCK
jgi:hypothetical protein